MKQTSGRKRRSNSLCESCVWKIQVDEYKAVCPVRGCLRSSVEKAGDSAGKQEDCTDERKRKAD